MTDSTPPQFKFSVNGQDGGELQNLPPEARQKIAEALDKLKNNAGLFGAIGTLTGLAKTARQFGITRLPDLSKLPESDQIRQFLESGKMPDGANVQSRSSISIATDTAPSPAGTEQPTLQQESVNIHKASPNYYKDFNNRRSQQPTFNPDVKNDAARIKVFIIGLLILAGYLVYRFLLNGQIPQEWLDTLAQIFE
jgi:hypothetical protein